MRSLVTMNSVCPLNDRRHVAHSRDSTLLDAPERDRSITDVQIVPFDTEQLNLARSAFRHFGKGRHRAGLNFGNCVTYALAAWSGEPLLYKGADFRATDIPAAQAAPSSAHPDQLSYDAIASGRRS